MTFAAVCAILIGVAMVCQWSLSIIKGQVAGPEAGYVAGRGATEMGFHYAAEFITAAALVAGGLGLLLGSAWAMTVYLIAMGMLLYTLVNSPGYFAQQRQWAMVGMFGVFLILALASLGLVL